MIGWEQPEGSLTLAPGWYWIYRDATGGHEPTLLPAVGSLGGDLSRHPHDLLEVTLVTRRTRI